MKKYILLFLALGFFSCRKEVDLRLNIKTPVNQGKDFQVIINNINHSEVDKIDIYIDEKKLKTLDYADSFLLNIGDEYKLGTHQMKFDFRTDDELLQSIPTSITVFAPSKPKMLKYKLVNTYPHDIDAFTQGLEFSDSVLYEGTGLNGESGLRVVNVKTGKVLKKIDLDKRYFGEGITILKDKIYQLTWQSGMGFIYDKNSLKKTGEFKYNQSKEGWGLCNDGKNIYKSDGTERIWIINPDSMREADYINIYTDRHKITRINEMEWVDGKIYTNVWQKNALAIINPKTGAVEGIINLSDLHKMVTQHAQLDVLNGIAYDAKSKHLFVTGKKWDKMFEIELLNK